MLLGIGINSYAKSGEEIIKDLGLKPEVQPLLTTEWCQEGAENSLLPTINNKRVVTGCGVTALAQVMRYWAYPTSGHGENYYIWDYPSTGREVLYANFNHPYDWDNMINRYKDNESASEVEIQAVATLMRDLGIALQVKYEDSATPTNIEYISSVLKRYFSYNPTMTIHRNVEGVYTMDEWLGMIYTELSEGRPIIMGGYGGGANHIYVADGYDSDGKVHLNLGKGNPTGSINTDGYYDLTRTDQTYTSNMRMLIGIAPYYVDTPILDFSVEQPGTLQEALGGDLPSRRLCRIRLHGYLNNDDFKCLKRLSAITTGQLSYIDMSDVIIDGDEIPEEAFRDAYTLQEIILPKSLKSIAMNAFKNANGLWKVILPEGLEEIGSYAFSACRYLESLALPTSLNEMGANPMRYLHLSELSIGEGNDSFIISNSAVCDKDKTALYAMPLTWTDKYSIEEGITTVRYHAFSMQAMIPEVYIPSSVKRLMKWAFFECISLKNLYVAASNPPTLDDECFSKETLSQCTLHIPAGTLTDYMNSDWAAFATIVEDENLATPSLSDNSNKRLTGIFDLNGQSVTSPLSSGIYVLRFSDGTTSKIIY